MNTITTCAACNRAVYAEHTVDGCCVFCASPEPGDSPAPEGLPPALLPSSSAAAGGRRPGARMPAEADLAAQAAEQAG